MENVKVGDKIRIINMKYNPSIVGDYEACMRYKGKEGIVETIDDIGQLHGTWGGLAVIPGEDEFVVIL